MQLMTKEDENRMWDRIDEVGKTVEGNTVVLERVDRFMDRMERVLFGNGNPRDGVLGRLQGVEDLEKKCFEGREKFRSRMWALAIGIGSTSGIGLLIWIGVHFVNQVARGSL
jgi:hypothetical protein